MLFTSGSKSSDAPSVGSACINEKNMQFIERSLYIKTSIYTAESIAIKDATHLALQNPNQNCYIFTDSLSVLKSLKKPTLDIKTNPNILEIKKHIFTFITNTTNNSNIHLIWIPSHIGIRGNELADKIAKSASLKHPSDDQKIPFTDLKQYIRADAIINTYNIIEAEDLDKGKDYFLHYHNRHSKPWYHNKHLSRECITSINRCKSNHYNLAYSLNRVNIIDSNRCQCGDVQDLNHILWQCPVHDTQRLHFLKKLREFKLFLPLSSTQLLFHTIVNIFKCLVNYTKSCNLQI